MRGRDIKRNGYEWAKLYCICTFPAAHIDIRDYPSIEKWFKNASWSDEVPNGAGQLKLEQTGTNHSLNGRSFKSRKKTGNKWFETQDQIAYMDDFSRQRFVWTAVNSEYRFLALENEIYYNNSVFHGVIDKAKGIASIMNSLVMQYYFKLLFTSGYQYGGKEMMEQIPIPLTIKNNDYSEQEIGKIYHLTEEEMCLISSSVNEKAL